MNPVQWCKKRSVQVIIFITFLVNYTGHIISFEIFIISFYFVETKWSRLVNVQPTELFFLRIINPIKGKDKS